MVRMWYLDASGCLKAFAEISTAGLLYPYPLSCGARGRCVELSKPSPFVNHDLSISLSLTHFRKFEFISR